MIGKTIDQLKVGDAAEFGKTISESDVYLYAGVTGDVNPAHIDEVYASNTHFKTRIAHGMLTAGLISGLLGVRLPGPGTIYIRQELDFLAPVHIGDTVTAIDGKRATLKSGGVIEADIVVVGVGVRPRLGLAEKAGLAIDRGVTVDIFMETNVSGVYAAGDIARWPDAHSGESIRVEHWVVAERQGQTAARNMLGHRERFDAVPFFWSQHYDVPINYVGHAEKWDEIAVDGDIAGRDCLLRYKRGGRVLAVASIYRDVASLDAELAMETALAY